MLDPPIHDQIIDSILMTNIMQYADVRMVQTRDGFRFALEALLANRIRRQVSGKNLDGNRAVQTRVARALDFAHSARTKRRNNLVWPEPGAAGQFHNGEDYIPQIKCWR